MLFLLLFWALFRSWLVSHAGQMKNLSVTVNSPACKTLRQRGIFLSFPVKASHFHSTWEVFVTSLCTRDGSRTLKTHMSFLNERQLVGEEPYTSPTPPSYTSCEVIPANPTAVPHHPSWLCAGRPGTYSELTHRRWSL